MFTTFSASTASSPSRACDTCRKLKIKCRNVRPVDHHPCDQCRQEQLKCTYRDQPARRGRPPQIKNIKRGYATLAKVIDMGSPVPAGKPTIKSFPTDSTRFTPASISSPSAFSSSSSPGKGVGPSHQSHDEAVIQPPGQVLESGTQLSPAPSEDPTLLETITYPLDQFLPADFTVASVPRGQNIQGPDAKEPQDIWASVHEFFNTVYIIFPVISYVELTSRLIVEPDWATSPDLRTLLYALRLWNASANYRIGLQRETELRELISQVETSRLTYDFADPATLDAVACSLCLFTAYNVLGKHNRAFLYLEEASSLLEAVIPSSDVEEERRRRIERVLFNTESAAFPLYATRSVRRRARRPPARWEQYHSEQDVLGMDIGTERVATHLLRHLTQIHLAQGANDLCGIGVKSEADMETLFGTGILRQHRYSRIQSADVVMTHQWQLSCNLVASSGNRSSAKEVAGPAVDALGVVAMSWICVLREGDLRVVGLGKLAGLTMNVFRLGGARKYQDVLRGLVGAVMREDHEGHYSLPLAEMILPTLQTVPQSIPSRIWVGDTCHGKESSQTDLQPERPDVESCSSQNDLGSEAWQHDEIQWTNPNLVDSCDTEDWLSYLN